MAAAHDAYRARFAYPGWVPPGWTFCRRCGEPWPPKPSFWSQAPRWRGRLCMACAEDAQHGTWPIGRRWGRKHRWDADGALRRRCSTCRLWRLIEEFAPRYERREINLQSECGECTRTRMRHSSRQRRRAAA